MNLELGVGGIADFERVGKHLLLFRFVVDLLLLLFFVECEGEHRCVTVFFRAVLFDDLLA